MIGTSSPRARKNSCYLARIKEHVCVTRGSIAIIRTIYYSYSCLKEPRKSPARKELPILITNCFLTFQQQKWPKNPIKNPTLPSLPPLLTSFPCNGVSVKSAFDTAIRAEKEREKERGRKRTNRGAQVVPPDSPCTSPLEGYDLVTV